MLCVYFVNSMSWLSCVENIPIVAGIPAEVWVAEKLPENPDDPYSTIEIFFADPEYTVQIGSYTV